ncbi:MAG: hypothetical protein WAX77_10580 [Methylococcaceae bacterium]
MTTIISFVVDGLALHYYQAELLLFSLNHFAKHPIENIIVHCTNRVDSRFINFLKKNNYKIIEPFLDGKYCNKIKQLDTFNDIPDANILLLDTDTFVLKPLIIPNENLFHAKIVDAENPPLTVIKRIFQQAAIELPNIINTDWHLNNALTIATNFNGGFYYIPQKYSKVLNEAWKKWAAWLFAKPELFDNHHQIIHTDQVAMALALCESQIDYYNIASNYNCPIHNATVQNSFIKELPVILLHYHRELNTFGLLKKENASNASIKSAIETANQAIANYADFEFYSDYRKSLIQTINITSNTEKLTLALAKFKKLPPLTIILHAGTPKTGTTSLQYFLANKGIELKKQGFLYPNNYSQIYEPKHQWLVVALLNNNINIIIDEFNKIALQLDETIHTIILSTEGIYNHWFDYSQEAKSFLAVIAQYFSLNLWVCFREPLSLMDSLYCQYLKNPKIPSINCYGYDWSLIDMLKDEWFIKHLDYLGFIYEIEALLGKEHLFIHPYQENSVAVFINKLSLTIDFNEVERKNTKLGKISIELLKIINQQPLTHEEKADVLVHLTKIDTILATYQQQSLIDETSKQIIMQLCALGLQNLYIDYQIDFLSII